MLQRLSVPLNAIKYSPVVKKLWYVGKLLLKNKFINRMREVPEQIKFPVPDNLYNPDTKIHDKIKFGFIDAMVDLIAEDKDNKKFNLSCDLKVINSIKIDPLGMVDLGGFETPPTKRDVEERL